MATAMKVPTIFTAVDRFSHVVDRMSKSASAFGATAQASAMRTSRALSSAGTSMLTAGVVMATGIGYAVNEAAKFEKSMSNVSTTIDSTPELMKSMSDSVLNMAKKLPVPISQLTEALYDVVSAGIDAKDSMFVLEQSARLGIAGLGTSTEGVDIITSSLNAFNIKASESAKVANMVFKAVKYGKTTVSGIAESFGSSAALVKNSNVSLEEYLATTAVLTTTGMTASRAQTQVSSAVTALIKPSKTMSLIFSKLGVRDIPKWIKTNGGLVNSMRIVRNEADKMGILTSKAFGRKEGFSAMLSLLGPLANKFKEVYGDIKGSSNSMDEAVAKQQKTFSAGVQRMKNNLTILAIKIGNQLIPRLNGFLDRLTPIVEKTTSWMEKNSGLVDILLDVTVGLLALGAALKIGAVLFYGIAKVIGIVSAVTKAYTFISTLAALANVSFATALWGVVTALWAAVWPVLAVVAALAVMAVWIYDVVNHWEDWKEILLVIVGPIGWITMGLLKIIEHSNKIRNAFAFEGWFGGLKAIGRMLVDMILTPLEKIFNVMSRLPMVGNHFKFMSASIADYRSGFSATKSVGNLSGASQFQNLGGVMPTWGAAENLAGKNQNQASMEKGGTLRVVIDDKTNKVKDVDDTNVYGIPVVLSGNQGNWGR